MKKIYSCLALFGCTMFQLSMAMSNELSEDEQIYGTALYHAVEREDITEVGNLLESGNNTVNVKAQLDGRTPLHIAACRGRADIATILLAYGADVNVVDRGGRTPLYEAAGLHDATCAKSLLYYGANPDVLIHCDYHLLSGGNYETPLFKAAREDMSMLLRSFLAIKQILVLNVGVICSLD